ncbi:hypothetical protein SAMN06298226_1006 [Nitrosovibrio sp. Nv4]|nr:hypothetical protein SAMN06298226_1006 [Nitrosovibrio sp. Nv4]
MAGVGGQICTGQVEQVGHDSRNGAPGLLNYYLRLIIWHLPS